MSRWWGVGSGVQALPAPAFHQSQGECFLLEAKLPSSPRRSFPASAASSRGTPTRHAPGRRPPGQRGTPALSDPSPLNGASQAVHTTHPDPATASSGPEQAARRNGPADRWPIGWAEGVGRGTVGSGRGNMAAAVAEPGTSPLRVGFVGAGRMAEAIAQGFIRAGKVEARHILASAPTDRNLCHFQALGCQTTHSNREVLQNCLLVFFATKPHVLPTVLAEVAPVVTSEHILVSVAAGVSLSTLEELLPPTARVLRVSPNLPCVVQEGAMVMARGRHAGSSEAKLLQALLEACGQCEEVPEAHVDIHTGLSGSGVAYVCAFSEALAEGAIKMGMPGSLAHRIAAQTLLGTAKMLQQNGQHPAQLRTDVCTPGGTTIYGLHALERGGLRAAAMSAVEAATCRARELSGKQGTAPGRWQAQLTLTTDPWVILKGLLAWPLTEGRDSSAYPHMEQPAGNARNLGPKPRPWGLWVDGGLPAAVPPHYPRGSWSSPTPPRPWSAGTALAPACRPADARPPRGGVCSQSVRRVVAGDTLQQCSPAPALHPQPGLPRTSPGASAPDRPGRRE
ncbi:pyrroline-5-carboxylate reductase 3 [Enhydra lutris kenyoni]|uniref:Pyrroline-5-carboxylate reductase n=1 Tax=Enhydra lutris kenyoni TaxID=391180 RepID=A0A2Y9JAT6_ENHLU|nr:pyrroline-5-carboxylate reductase 3 [Enhydra lutris kenyoni]